MTAPTIDTTRALCDVIDLARATRLDAEKKRRPEIAHRLGVIISQLDAARTRLVQDGTSYQAAADALAHAGRVAVRNYRRVVS